MTEEPIPADVREFILENIDSVAQLEALLLLRDNSERAWDIASLAQRLYIGGAEAQDILNGLVVYGLAINEDARFRYAARDESRQALIDGVALAYKRYLVPVTRLIHDKSQNIRKFADAFRFRKDK